MVGLGPQTTEIKNVSFLKLTMRQEFLDWEKIFKTNI
jgi:hypothetical protein